jgi:putative peptide zinc metalloprotease protein
MTQDRALFSESWHRVASQRLRLRPSVRIRRQSFRGDTWYVAQDAFTNQFYRFRPEAYAFIARLDGTRTIEQLWLLCLDRDPDRAPGQGEIVSMLSQLYQANLIVSDIAPDTARLFERHQRRLRQEIKSQVFGIFFLRIRVFDPENFLNRAWPVLGRLCTRAMGVVWLVVVAAGLAAVFSHWDLARNQGQSVLEPGNLLLLYAGFTLAKLVHEFGHATAVKKFGGEVHAMGVTLLVFTPIPYVDATAAWAFRERWKRVMVGLSGMIPELFLASLCALLWANTGPGLANSLAYNVMVVASVSTLVFNLNPLLRFDGYYVLADLTDSPNLQPRSAREWSYLVERHAFGLKTAENPARSTTEGFWLAVYGVASWSYRMFVTVVIILLVADRYFGIGLLAGAVTFVGSFVLPVVGAATYLMRAPRLLRVRKRAWLVTGCAAALVAVLFGAIPLPHHFRAPGTARAAGSAEVHTRVDGWVSALDAQGAEQVRKNGEVARLENPELDLKIAAARADVEECLARERQMLTSLPAGIEPMRLRRQASEADLAELIEDRDALSVRAPEGGTWSPRGEENLTGTWLARGGLVGEVVGRGPAWEFLAVVPQSYAGELFSGRIRGGEIRFPGTSGEALPITGWQVVPGRQDTLPSAALGWSAKGPVRVQLDDPRGIQTAEPFFLVIARVTAPVRAPGEARPRALWQGRTGTIRFDLPPSPLLVRWVREFRQLLQQRYRI